MAGGSVTSLFLKSCFSCGEDPSQVPQGKFVDFIIFYSNSNNEWTNHNQNFCLFFVANKSKDGPSFLSIELVCFTLYGHARQDLILIFSRNFWLVSYLDTLDCHHSKSLTCKHKYIYRVVFPNLMSCVVVILKWQ